MAITLTSSELNAEVSWAMAVTSSYVVGSQARPRRSVLAIGHLVRSSSQMANGRWTYSSASTSKSVGPVPHRFDD